MKLISKENTANQRTESEITKTFGGRGKADNGQAKHGGYSERAEVSRTGGLTAMTQKSDSKELSKADRSHHCHVPLIAFIL